MTNTNNIIHRVRLHFRLCLVLVILACVVNCSHNPYYPPPPPPPPQQQQQQQQQDQYGQPLQYQQPQAQHHHQQQQQQQYPPQQHIPQPTQGSSYGGSGYGMPPSGYGRMPPPSQQENPAGGLFSKLKSSIIAAGSAISGNLDNGGNNVPSPFQGRRPMSGGPPPPSYPQRHNGPQGMTRGPPGMPSQPSAFGQRPNVPHDDGNNPEGGLFGKIKNFFGNDGNDGPGGMGPGKMPDARRPPAPSAFGSPPGGYRQPQSNDPYMRQAQPPLPSMQQQSPPYGYPSSQQQPPPPLPPLPPTDSPYGTPSVASGIDSMPYGQPPAFQPQQQQQSYDGGNMDYAPMGDAYSQADLHQQQQPQVIQVPIVEPEALIPPEPQVFVVEDCIVLVLKPKEFFRKKAELTRGGASNLQVFTDFEHVLTRFKTDDNMRSMGTAEVLESSSAILHNAVTQIKSAADDFENRDMDHDAFEELTSKCHSIIARDAGLHISSVAPLTREFLPKIPLRDGWKESFQTLAVNGVPFYIFSSGYGDIVAQSLIQGGVSDDIPQAASMAAGPSTLPQNVRIISNFFRTAPDGSVRAFSQPVVHERNKNATTASRHMGMPVPERLNAIVLGSHEDDVAMTDGVGNLQTQLSIGFLEMSDDLPQRLSTFLNSYDAVVLGDGSFQYIKSLLDEILKVNRNVKPRGRLSIFERGLMGVGGVDIF